MLWIQGAQQQYIAHMINKKVLWCWPQCCVSDSNMTLINEDMNRILEYLTRNDQELDGANIKMDCFQQDTLMVCTFKHYGAVISDKIYSQRLSEYFGFVNYTSVFQDARWSNKWSHSRLDLVGQLSCSRSDFYRYTFISLRDRLSLTRRLLHGHRRPIPFSYII